MFKGDVGVATTPHIFGSGHSPKYFTQVNQIFEILIHSQEDLMPS